MSQGETHLYRRPGALRFSTPEARDDFKKIVLEQMKPIPRLYKVASDVDERIRNMNEGRAYL